MSSDPIAQRLRPYSTSVFAMMSKLAVEHGAVNLGQGFPDFDGPAFIKDAAKRAIDRESNQYAPLPGIPSLRRAVAERFTRSTGLSCDPDTQVCITCGCTEAICAALLGLCDPGDKVAVIEPFFDSYRGCLALANAEPIPVALRPIVQDGKITEMRLDEAELRAAMAQKPKAILFNTPHNPTGKVFTPAELALIAQLCIEHNVIAISDEVYERLLFPSSPLCQSPIPSPQSHPRHISIASLPGMADRTLTLSSMGKTFSLTGWKVGWIIGAAPLVTAARAAHQQMTFSIATPLQHAAVEAIQREEEAVADLLPLLTENRTRLAHTLTRLGVEYFLPEGTYFIYAKHAALSERLGPASRGAGVPARLPSETHESLSTSVAPDGGRGRPPHAHQPAPSPDVAACMALLKLPPTSAGQPRNVAAIPPSVFYCRPHLGHDMIRFAFCKKRETMDEGIKRLERLL